MGKRKRTIKRTIVLFWKGLTGIIAATAEWFTVILGMKDESKYGKFIRRVVGGCFAFIMFVFACAGGNALYEFVYKKVNAVKYLDDSYYDSQYLSRNATYYSRAYETDGYVTCLSPCCTTPPATASSALAVPPKSPYAERGYDWHP